VFIDITRARACKLKKEPARSAKFSLSKLLSRVTLRSELVVVTVVRGVCPVSPLQESNEKTCLVHVPMYYSYPQAACLVLYCAFGLCWCWVGVLYVYLYSPSPGWRSSGLARFVFESSSLLALVAAAPAGVIAAGAPLVRRCAAGVLAGLGAGRGR
jgi:hypothetical protein